MAQNYRVTVKHTVADARILKSMEGRSDVYQREILANSKMSQKDTIRRLQHLYDNDLIRAVTGGGIPTPRAYAITDKGNEALVQLAPHLAERS